MDQRSLHDRVFRSGAVRVRQTREDPVYWYESNLPGPFYVQGERLLGQSFDVELERLSELLASPRTMTNFVSEAASLILAAYDKSDTYRSFISDLIREIRKREITFDTVSGGERRDWLFSLPVARVLGLPHVWLFKKVPPHLEKGAEVASTTIHVADLLNRGQSHKNYWLPALDAISLSPVLAIFAIDRSVSSINYLLDKRIPYASVHRVDHAFFCEAERLGLISRWAFQEISLYFRSPDDWLRDVYMPNFPKNSAIEPSDWKSVPRRQKFCENFSLPVTAFDV